MAESFDPYYKWLAIPTEDQPPSHYRLLAIESGEGDAEVIANAADQRISHLRILEMGEQGSAAAALIAEIQAARDCLLDAEKRAAYDAHLNGDADTAEPALDAPFVADSVVADSVSAEEPVFDSVNRSTSGNKTDSSRNKKKNKEANKKAKKISIIGHIVAPIVGLALGGIILFVIKSIPSEKEDPSQIEFEIGGMRQDDGQDESVSEVEAETETEETEGAEASGADLLSDEQSDFAEAAGEIVIEEEPVATKTIDRDVIDEGSNGGEGAIVSDENSVIDFELPQAESLEIEAEIPETEQDDADPSTVVPDLAATEDTVINEQADSIEAQRIEQEAALVDAIEIGDLLLQLKIASSLAMLKDEDSWKQQVALLEQYKQRAAGADDGAIAQAAVSLSRQAKSRDREGDARVLAVEALQAARRDGNPALLREVTAYILQSSFAESE